MVDSDQGKGFELFNADDEWHGAIWPASRRSMEKHCFYCLLLLASSVTLSLRVLLLMARTPTKPLVTFEHPPVIASMPLPYDEDDGPNSKRKWYHYIPLFCTISPSLLHETPVNREFSHCPTNPLASSFITNRTCEALLGAPEISDPVLSPHGSTIYAYIHHPRLPVGLCCTRPWSSRLRRGHCGRQSTR